MPTSFATGAPPLAQLQPLQFQPIRIPEARFAPVSTPVDTRIEDKIQASIDQLGKGVVAAYKTKKDEEKELRREALDQAKEDRKFQQQLQLKGIESQQADEKRQQALQDRKDLIEFGARFKSTTPRSVQEKHTPIFNRAGVSFVPQKTAEQPVQPSSTQGATESEIPASEPVEKIQGTNLFQNLNLPDSFDDQLPPDSSYDSMEGVGGSGSGHSEITPISSPLSDLTSPVEGNQYDMLRELQNLGPIDAKYLSASTGSGAPSTPALPIASSQDWLRRPKSVLQSSDVVDKSYEEASKALKSITTPADIVVAQAKKVAVSPETPLSAAVATNERPPRTGFPTEEDALDYIQQHPKGSNWAVKESPKFDDKTGTWWVSWQPVDTAKAAQAEAAREIARDKLSRLNEAGLASEVDKFNKDPVHKIMQARPMQIAEFQAAMDEAFDPDTKKSRRAVDLDAIDKFVMFARGTQPTEAQYSEIQNWTQGYLQDVKQKIEKGVEGARLSENDYETMMNLMYRAYNTTAKLANPEISDLREVVKAKHPKLMEQELPHEHMYYEVPSFFKEKVGDAQDEMRQYHSLMQLAKEQNDRKAFAEAKAKYEEAVAEQNKQLKNLARAKASKKPLNMKQFKRGGWLQGRFGGVSDLGAAGMTPEGQ